MTALWTSQQLLKQMIHTNQNKIWMKYTVFIGTQGIHSLSPELKNDVKKLD